VATSLCLALPGQSQSLQAQDVGAAATRMLEQQRKPRNRVSFAEYQRPAPGEMPTPTVVAPVATWLALAPPALSQSQQAQEAAAATRMLEQRHEEESSAFPEYQRPTPGETLAATVGVPVATWLAFASPAQLQSQQAQEVAAATRMLEQRRHEEERASFAEYQQQRQHALAAEAGLQQALAAQQESQQLMLYTLDGRAASYETKWDDLHPVSQGLLLQIEYDSLCSTLCSLRLERLVIEAFHYLFLFGELGTHCFVAIRIVGFLGYIVPVISLVW